MSGSPHRRLLAWQLARGLSADVLAFTRSLPGGFEALGRQTERATFAALEEIVVGAAAAQSDAKVAAWIRARGELTELEASLDACELLGLGTTDDLRMRTERIAGLLTGLVERAETLSAI